MKKILIPLLVITMLSLTVLPAAAGQGGPGDGKGQGQGPMTTPQPTPQGQGTMTAYRQSSPRGIFAVIGTISALDETNQTVTIKVLRGNKLVQPYLNTDITVKVTEKTKLLYREAPGVATPITFSDLAVGDAVSINGRIIDNVWTASRITKGATLKCLP